MVRAHHYSLDGHCQDCSRYYWRYSPAHTQWRHVACMLRILVETLLRLSRIRVNMSVRGDTGFDAELPDGDRPIRG
jgi:hypothetical protein